MAGSDLKQSNDALKVIVVYGDSAQRRLIASILEKEDINVVACNNPANALRHIASESPPDLIITDLNMPEIDGWRFCSLLRSPEYKNLNRVPIIVVSALFSGADARETALNMGADAVLGLPVEPDTLRRTVRALLCGKPAAHVPTVLLVEDRSLQARIIRQAAEERGYALRVVASGKEALHFFSRRPPEVAVIDHHLPDIRGEKLLQAFKRPPSHTVVIMVTAAPAAALTARWLRIGADACLHKPLHPFRLFDVIEKSRLTRALLRVAGLLETRTRQLRESEERLRLGLEGSEVGLWDWNLATGNIVTVRPWSEMLGYDPSEIQDSTEAWKRHIHPDDKDAVQSILSDHLHRRIPLYETEYRLRAKSGEWRWILSRGKVVAHTPRGAPLRMLGMHMDITRRKLVEESLKQLNQLLTSVIERSPLAIIVLDIEGKVALWNPAAVRIFGWTEDEVVGKPDPIITIGREEPFLDSVRKAAANITHTEYRTTCIAKDGAHRIISLSSAPIFNASGDEIGFVALMADITERCRLEEQLRQAQRLDSIGRLAGGIAHDFNNLLTAILGYASVLKLECPPGSPGHEAAGTIELAAERASDLTAQLLGFARKGKDQNVPVDLHKTIQEVLRLLSRTIDKNIRIRPNLAASAPVTLGDPGQMHQVFLNLAMNARDAMPHGGDLLIATENVQVNEDYCRTQPLAKPGPYVVAEITDTGCGMSKEIRKRIFDPFFTTKKREKGIGMGLATAFGIVRNHKGWIDVHSEEGRGATFKVYLPPAPRRDDIVAPAGEETPPVGSGTVLLVDDEDVVRRVGTAMLRRLGYTPLSAATPAEAVEIYRMRADEIRLVIIDMVMPEMDGRQCFEALKRINPRVRAVLSSGHGCNGRARNIIKEGMVGFIQKPYRMDALARAVAEALKA